ncbi:serine O-acetyltransferase EpsC [Planctomicrobium sp. SH527]|uniref:serine O-acetyltransferase EpsC n=1 Tax=Planctomicrobium sp. SH527 TaxID=3448123 RepID=UPI003F5C9ECC
MTSIRRTLEFRSVSDHTWNVDAVVSELRKLRDRFEMAEVRNHGKLPNRRQLTSIVERLSSALFPVRLSTRDFPNGNIDYFVGHTLDIILTELVEEVNRELLFLSEYESSEHYQSAVEDLRQKSVQIVRDFAGKLPEIRSLLESDIQAAFDGDPAATCSDEILACYPGTTAIIHYRLANALYSLGAPLVARIVSEIAHSLTGIDIHPGASIQERFFIDHGTGVVIGETARIGKNVRLYQAVTLGAKRFMSSEEMKRQKGISRHPIVEDNVVIYAGATILGRVTIGAGSIIGGNVWLTTSVAPGSNITQAKVRHESFDEGLGI